MSFQFEQVTLMYDEDPRKRCFHCVLTDSPGTKGELGVVTPELLETLFSSRDKTSFKEGKINTKLPHAARRIDKA